MSNMGCAFNDGIQESVAGKQGKKPEVGEIQNHMNHHQINNGSKIFQEINLKHNMTQQQRKAYYDQQKKKEQLKKEKLKEQVTKSNQKKKDKDYQEIKLIKQQGQNANLLHEKSAETNQVTQARIRKGNNKDEKNIRADESQLSSAISVNSPQDAISLLRKVGKNETHPAQPSQGEQISSKKSEVNQYKWSNKEYQYNEKNKNKNDSIYPEQSLTPSSKKEKQHDREWQKFDGNKNYIAKKYPGGLPNIGNTCFLNSIIQFIFGATKFRKLLVEECAKVTLIDHTTGCETILGYIFQILEQKQGYHDDKKRQLLRILVNRIENLNLFYTKYSQEDALQTLMSLLSAINENLSHKQPNTLFNLDIEFKCPCMRQEYISETLYTTYEAEQCTKCKRPFAKRIINQPEYIIYTNNTSSPEKIKYINSEPYRLVSQIVYMGSGRAGHYTCLRVVDDKTYEFNDSSVYERREEGEGSKWPSWAYCFSSSKNTYSYDKHLLLLYEREKTINKPYIFKGNIPEQNNQEEKMDIQYDSGKKMTEPERSATKQDKQINRPQEWLCGDIYSNRAYSATINISCKVKAPHNQIGFKPFTLFFQLQGSRQNIELNVLNDYNFLFYEVAEKKIKEDIKKLTSKSYCYLRNIVDIIEQRLHNAFKEKASTINYDRKQLVKIVKKINQQMDIPNEQTATKTEKIYYQSNLK